MKLIFLDFDGVLHPNFCQEEHYFDRTVDATFLDKASGYAQRQRRFVSS
jgi:hypothetical protein